MSVPSFSQLRKIVQACMKVPALSADDAAEYLRTRICYGPTLPQCKRCLHTICPCCYPGVLWCDSCLSEGDICGTVDNVDELKTLDVRTVPEFQDLFKRDDELICIQSLDSGMVHMHVKSPRKGLNPSIVPGYNWKEGWHPACEDACDVVIPEDFSSAMDDWEKRKDSLTAKSVYYTTTSDDVLVACSDEAWKEILDLVGLPDRKRKNSSEEGSAFHRALYEARGARRASRSKLQDDYSSNKGILKRGVAALSEKLKERESVRFVQLIAHGAIEEPQNVPKVWEASDVKDAVDALEVEQ